MADPRAALRGWLPARLLVVALALTIAPTLLPARTAAAQAPDPEETAIAQLRKATKFRSDGLHHAVLLALRDLRDPAMKPLFQSLIQADHWTIQLDAVLGLAELDATYRVDPFLLGRLRDETDRADAIRVAMEMGMLDRERIEKILSWDDLPAVARVVLLAELRRLGGTPDEAVLKRLAANPDPAIAGLAICIIAQMAHSPGDPGAGPGGKPADKPALPTEGDAPDPDALLAEFGATLHKLPRGERDVVVEELAAAARRYDLPVAIDLLSFRVTGDAEDPGPQEQVVGMALSLDPKRGLPLWKKLLGPAPTHGQRVRSGLILLLSAKRLAPDAFDAIVQGDAAATDTPGEKPAEKPADDPLLRTMVAAGKAIASGKNTAKALIDLYDAGSRRTCRWVLASAEDIDAENASAVYQHIIRQLETPKQRTAERRNDAIDAAARLVERDPDALMTLLESAVDDGPVQEAILLGLANSRSPRAGDAAATVRRIGVGRTDSLALLLLARHRDTLDPEDRKLLGLIAGGGGGVDETLRAQAAWLYLKHAGKLETAIAKVAGSS